ncbi:hypothetical protein UTI89UKE3_061 [Escherichia phage vB_EcoP-UTI89UKE3]|uniref:Uncharacterized protein n=1 Tax=Escherichia phage vB_EcoP-UTI89UKE2 TaxID=2865826 RepID=A0AAE7XU82_9CAUD|nr:hypothetical protein UTI89UKE2_061 [Escherichia phage vB_EcoP-UTI89UKE2]QZI84662.1 hypothetical protein UTI89UKE3_061 [Escherichia phage vB_EcoP-UTI89UKE3]
MCCHPYAIAIHNWAIKLGNPFATSLIVGKPPCPSHRYCRPNLYC